MDSVQQSFLAGNPERAKDGKVLFAAELNAMVTGRLSSREVSIAMTIVVTEQALYELKGSNTKQKEHRRIAWKDIGAILISADKDNRFVIGTVDNQTKTYEAYTATTRKTIIDTARNASNDCDVDFLIVELPDVHIAKLVKVCQSNRSSKSNIWPTLLVGSMDLSNPLPGDLRARKSGLNGSDLKSRSSNLLRLHPSTELTDLSAGTTAGNSGDVQDRVGAVGNIGPMTLLWRRLESALQPHVHITSAVADDSNAIDIIERLKNRLKTDNSPFSAQGAPKEAAQAMTALSAVLMDETTCGKLVRLFAKGKASSFLGAMEGNLGCGDQLVRRWTALSFFFALPVFAEAGNLPNTAGWSLAASEYTAQTRRRENAVLGFLFSSSSYSTKTATENLLSTSGDLLISNTQEKVAERSRFNKLRVLTKSSDSKPLTPASMTTVESRKPSILTFSFSGISGNDVEDAILEPSDRRLRGALALMWASRLLDLESNPKTDEGIKKSDVQTMIQMMLAKCPDPVRDSDESIMNTDFEVETFGADVDSPEFLPCIFSSLIATRDDSVRHIGLKQMSILVLKNASAVRAFLSTPDWQSVVFSSLYNVPYTDDQETLKSNDVFRYSMHIVTVLHMAVFGSRQPNSEFGPIDKLLGQTIYKIAVHYGWGEPSIKVVRSLFTGILNQLITQVRSPTCTWKHSPMNDEWEELFRFFHLLQTFLFYRPMHIGLKGVPPLTVEASIKASRGLESHDHSDWRSRINFRPLLCRIHSDRLVSAHRQMYAKLGMPVMTATHRGDETGVHLDETGKCHDRRLVEDAIAFWNTLKITGNPKDDQKKSEEFMIKSDRSRIMYASNVCRELNEVLRLFDVIDEKRNQLLAVRNSNRKKLTPVDRGSAKSIASASSVSQVRLSAKLNSSGTIEVEQKDQVQAIAYSKATDFLEKQKKKDANVGFLTKAKTKNQATNLRSNMLQKREVAVRKLGSGSDKVQAQVASTVNLPPASSGGRTTLASIDSKLQIRADEIIIQSPLARDEEKTVFERETSSSKLSINGIGSTSSRSKTLVKLRRTNALPSNRTIESIDEDTSLVPKLLDDANTIKENLSVIIGQKRPHAPTCHGCDKSIDEEVNEVSKFKKFWHSDCLVCSNCECNILTKDNASKTADVLDTSIYYPNARILVCSIACRNAVLNFKGDTRCPTCLDGFNPNETAVQACGYSYHADSGCFQCIGCETPFGKNEYFEVQGQPYCRKCLDTKFLHCKMCSRPLLDTDKVVEAVGGQFHEHCFACTVCREPFKDDNFYSKHGELFCFNHYLQRRSPPCAMCHLPLNHKRNGVIEDPVAISGLTFHKSCFNCSKCSRVLKDDAKPGSDEEPNEHGGMLYCSNCYAEEFGIKCYACEKVIRGDVLHAGTGSQGEIINWHPSCFVCAECTCPLLDVPFFLVSVGDNTMIPTCYDHYQTRYGNRKCPGCHNSVTPGRSRLKSDPSQEDDNVDGDIAQFLRRSSDRRASTVLDISECGEVDANPTVMFNDAMWHARCLTCDEESCDTSLYEEQLQKQKEANQFEILVAGGKKYCSEHYENHLDLCFACKQGIREQDPRADLMGWSFHAKPECFHCFQCNESIEPGQALIKLESGPAHQTCPQQNRRKSLWGRLKG